MSAAEKPVTKPGKAKGEKKAGKRWLLIVIAVVVLAAGGAAAWFFTRDTGGDEKPAAAKPASVPAPAQYFAMEPPFVVNLSGSGSARYLQIEVQLMTRSAEALPLIQLHAPAVRARLLMLFAQQEAPALMSREGKEKLQKEALAEARKVMAAETGKGQIDDLLFTSFVMQ
ncbi:flagellar basal body-associated FliL family protein [Pseudoxanthomonas mexicana]|uniref:flagellar basal body-associated FliL family protein n=1 Tax=Pseudoxanthomonas mexicana TaxID=128785 RepID=UPI00398A8C6E